MSDSIYKRKNGFFVCSVCDKDARQVRISSACVDMHNRQPIKCDGCRK